MTLQTTCRISAIVLLLTANLLTTTCGYTFNSSGKSLVKYTIDLDLALKELEHEEDTNPGGSQMKHSSNVSIEFRYKTWQGNGRLMTGSLIGGYGQEDVLKDSLQPLLELNVLIKEGDLCLSFDDVQRWGGEGVNESVSWYAQEEDVDSASGQQTCLDIQQGVHDNEWHTAVIEIGKSTVGIRDNSQRQTLDISLPASNLIQLQLQLPGSGEAVWFVGCLDLVTVSSDKQQDISPYLASTQDVLEGCIDRCLSENPCMNNGVCIDLYNRLACDCYSTGYVGIHCQDKDSSEVSLQGREWLSLNLLSLPDTEVYAVTHRVALHFKTVAVEGIVYYTKEEYPVYHHVAVSLKAGSLHVSVVFADKDRFNEVYTAIGTGLDDNRWHSVSVTLHKTEVLVILDGETEKMQNSGHHGNFHVPRLALFGGMQTPASMSQGLKSTKNLVGCLKEIYYNHVSVLDRLDEKESTAVVTYSGDEVIKTCMDPAAASVQFPRDGSFVTLDQPRLDKLVLALEFKTLKSDCLLLHSDVSTVVGGGFLQVSLQSGQLEMRVVISAPQPTPVKVVKIGDSLNNNAWHVLDLYYSNRRMDVRIDKENELTSLDLTLQFSSKLYLGFSPIINKIMGFAGCMKSITLNSMSVNPVDILHSSTSIGVSLGKCDLVDMCAGHIQEEFQCQNSGRCVSEWSDIYCDCHKVFFEGRYCQFGTLQRSCAGLYHSGVNESGVYYISAANIPVTVSCDMTRDLRASGVDSSHNVKTGVTIVSHNLRAQTQIRGKGLEDLKKIITYRSMDGPMLRSLIKSSAYCEQTLTFTCSQSPLYFGLNTWMASPQTKIVPVVKESEFNCDKAKDGLVRDSVTIRDASQLPVTEIYAYRAWGNASVMLSPLYCYGAESELPGFSLTFVKSSSYLILPWLWEGGLLMMEFRTVQSEALLLTQTQETAHNRNRELRISLRNGREVEVYLPHTDSPYLAVTRSWFNDSVWHSIQLETSRGEARLVVDKETFFIPIKDGDPIVTDSKTQLFVGGMPEYIASVYHLPGFTGCMRSIAVEDHLYQPIKYLGSGLRDILLGCESHCDSSPCQNNGHCMEKWTHYYCQCENPLAQSGENCETDINTDPISIEEGQLEFILPQRLMLKSLRIIFSFLTRERQTEVLHIIVSDRTLLSVHIDNGTYITATLHGEQKTSVQIWMLGLCQGSWKQALVEINNNLLQVIIGDQSKEARITGDLSAGQGDLQLVTGRDYKGCVRGIQVNGELLSLLQAIKGQRGMSAGCSDHCSDTSVVCSHGGQCVVDTTSKQIQTFCDCSLTGYAGFYCDRDIGAYFNGETVLVQWLQPYTEVYSHFLKVLFYFSTSVRNRRRMALLKLQSETDSQGHLFLYLTEECTLLVEISIQGQTVNLESSLSMCDGKSHRVTVTRLHRRLTLLVDDENIRRDLRASMLVTFTPSVVIVGASKIPNIAEGRAEPQNFTGNIANLFIVCDQLVITARPLDIASGFSQSNLERVTVYGQLQPATDSLINHRNQQTDPSGGFFLLSSRRSGMSGTLDPLKPKEAQTVALTTPAAVSEDEDDGGIFHPALAFGICILVLLILAIIVIIIYVRHYRNKTKRWAPVDSKKDEEEGLLPDSSLSSPSKDKAVEEENKVPEVTFRHGNKQPADKKKSQPPEEDDEATPMLLSMQPHLPDDNVELNNFQKQINKLPMIDDTVDESSLENEPAVPLSPEKTMPQENETDAAESKPEVLPDLNPKKEDTDNHTAHPGDPDKPNENPLIPNGQAEGQKPRVNGTHASPQVARIKMRHPPGVMSDRQALTESQVLDMLDTHEEEGETRTAPDHAADTSFSSLPEDCAQCVDLEIQADVHHRTMSFDSETAPETPDPNSNREPGISNGYSNQPEINGENTHCSNRSLTRIPEENCSSDKNGINNGINGSPEGNGHHSDLLNSHSKDSMKVNGPSYVIDNSLNEIHVDNSR